MAFDLINYIYDQTLQQNRGILAEHAKDERDAYLKHLIAFQIAILQSELEVNESVGYRFITQQDVEKLNIISLKSIKDNAITSNYYKKIEDKLDTINKKTAHTLISELYQLDKSASLGLGGTWELIQGQTEWMIETVDDWFWDATEKPQHKLTKSNKNNNTDFKHIVKEFSKIMQEKNNSLEHDDHIDSIELSSKTVQIPHFFQIIKPIVALLILLNLYNVIL